MTQISDRIAYLETMTQSLDKQIYDELQRKKKLIREHDDYGKKIKNSSIILIVLALIEAVCCIAFVKTRSAQGNYGLAVASAFATILMPIIMVFAGIGMVYYFRQLWISYKYFNGDFDLETGGWLSYDEICEKTDARLFSYTSEKNLAAAELAQARETVMTEQSLLEEKNDMIEEGEDGQQGDFIDFAELLKLKKEAADIKVDELK